MPECYTHHAIATEALMRSGNTVASHPAFMAGANGPDPFYFYHFWAAKPKPNLPSLAAHMHRENTGAFLMALVDFATTPVQQSYALGYLTHYATDCTLNPYLASMAQPNMPYAGKNGRTRMARDLDSTLYHRDYKTLKVPLHAASPVLITDELAQVTNLIREAVLAVYEQDTPLLALADAYHDNLTARKLLAAPPPVKSIAASVMAPRARYGGPAALRTQPGKRLPKLPAQWVNKYNQHEVNMALEEMLALAEQSSAICVTAAMRYWLGQLSAERLATVLGNNDLYTGQPCTPPAATAVPLDMPEAIG